MKMRKSSRIISFALALVMILPLISVPAFADDAVAQSTATTLLDENFNDKTVGDTVFGEKAAVAEGAGTNTTNVAKINNVYNRAVNGDHPELSYEDWSVVTFSANYYFDATAKKDYFSCFTSQIHTLNAYLTGKDTEKADAFYRDLFTVYYLNADDFANGPRLSIMGNGKIYHNCDAEGGSQKRLAYNTWYNIAVELNLKTGYMELYLDGTLISSAYFGTGFADITVYENRWIAAKFTGNGSNSSTPADETAANNFLLVDDLKITAEKATNDGVLFTEDYEGDKATAGANASIATLDGSTVAKTSSKYNDAIYTYIPAVNYERTPVIVLEADYYFVADQEDVGDFTSQFRYFHGDKADGSDGYAGYKGLLNFRLDATNNRYYVDMVGDTNADQFVIRPWINTNTWVTISIALDLANNKISVYADGLLGATSTLDATIVANAYSDMTHSYWIMAKGSSSSATGANSCSIDNVKVYTSEYGTGLLYGDTFDDTVIPEGQTFVPHVSSVLSSANGNSAAGDAATNANTLINDPTNSGKGIVWSASMAGNYKNSTGPKGKVLMDVNYYEDLVYEFDLYIPTGAKGYFGLDSYTKTRDSANTTNFGWRTLLTINVTSPALIVDSNPGDQCHAKNNTAIGKTDLTMKNDQWYNIAIALSLKTGLYTVYLDGIVVAEVNHNSTDIYYDFFAAFKAEANGVGNVYIDNVAMYSAKEPATLRYSFKGEYSEDYSTNAPAGQGSAVATVEGNNVAKIANKYNNAVSIPAGKHSGYEIVMEADYFLGFDADEDSHITSQYVFTSGWDKDGVAVPSQTWNNVYTIFRNDYEDTVHKAGYARIYVNGKDNTYYHTSNSNNELYVPRNEWFTVSTVVNLKTGYFTVYVNGVAYASSSWGLSDVSLLAKSYWIVAKYTPKYYEEDGTTYKEMTNYTYVDNVKVYDAATATKEEISIEKGVQYVDVTIGNKNSKTSSTKYLVRAGEAFSATPVYFNAEGEYNGIVSKPTDGTTSVRYGEPTGLRFKTTINEALVAELQA
ncbi:MAG: hypothetical protein IJX13_01945, partial [Clostridia bacterium]|nr:hypothetical protein [Clostridia bacterium]